MANARLTTLREEKGLTKAELAEALGISPSAVSAYELGARIPRDEVKIKIAEFFGVSVLDLFFGNEEHETCTR